MTSVSVLSSVGRTSVSKTGCRGFESFRARFIKRGIMNDTVNNIKTYLKSVRLEWSKITWPEKKQVISETIAVVAIVFLFTVAVYLIDIIFKTILGVIPTV